jgi:hypothetical protein
LGCANGLFDGGKLRLCAIQLVLVDQHTRLLAFLLFLDMLFYRCQNFPIQGSVVLFGNLSYLFQQMGGESDAKRLCVIFHKSIMALNWTYVKRVGPRATSPQTRDAHSFPPIIRMGLSAPRSMRKFQGKGAISGYRRLLAC